MKTYNTSRLSTTALTLATIASAFSLVSAASASSLDPADPYQYTSGQYPSMPQSYGLPPQYTGAESMGMRQARLASGRGTSVYEMSSGGEVSIEQSNTVNPGSPAIAANVAADEQNLSPVMRGIRQSLRAIATTRGAAAVADSNDITPTFADAPYDCHAMLAVYQQRISASSDSIESLQARAAQFAGDTQTNFNNAATDVSTARAQLDQDFAAAKTATPQNWDQVRSSLAVDYKRYSDAVAKAENIGNGSRSS